MQKWFITAVILSVAAAMPLTAQGAKDDVELLFVQTARNIKVDGGTLTLLGVSPQVVFFSDRPKRLAGHVTIAGFLQAWGEGKDSFKDDPPNASVSVVHDAGIDNTVVELSNPRLKGDNLTYDFRSLSGDSIAHTGATSVFIDGLFSGGPALSGVRGGALGALGGAIAGNTGAGLAIGAAVGVVGGALHEQ